MVAGGLCISHRANPNLLGPQCVRLDVSERWRCQTQDTIWPLVFLLGQPFASLVLLLASLNWSFPEGEVKLAHHCVYSNHPEHAQSLLRGC